MDAQFNWAARPRVARTVLTLAVLLASHQAHAAAYRTRNFTVDAPSPQFAKEIGDAAEHYRRELAIEWLGHELPDWAQACPIKAHLAPGAGGATSFVFSNGDVFDWRMNIQGSRERILDSVLPHEITHTIFASHFRQPLPRWADEGACTTVEHESEIAKQEHLLIAYLKSRPSRGIAFSQMFAMKDYPQDVLPLYAQGHSLARFLIEQYGKREFLAFLADGMRDENWPRAIKAHYQYQHLLALQNSWMDWVKAGRPPLQPMGGAVLASAQVPVPPTGAATRSVAAGRATLIYGQESDEAAPATTAPQSAASQAPVTPTPVDSRQAQVEPSAEWGPATSASPIYDASRSGVTQWR